MSTLREVLSTTGDDGKEGVLIGGKWPSTARLKYQSASPHHHLALLYDDMVGKSRATVIANQLLAGSAAVLDSLVGAIRKQKAPSFKAAQVASGASSDEAKALRAEMTAVITQAKEDVEEVRALVLAAVYCFCGLPHSLCVRVHRRRHLYQHLMALFPSLSSTPTHRSRTCNPSLNP